jgi:hypothetical protein
MPTTPIIGKDVDSWCTRCRMVLAHTIEAVVKGRVTRVHCNTCGGQHAYRASAPGSAAAGRAKRPARGNGARAAAKPARDYATLLRGRDPSTARGYAVTERFKEGEIIRHPTFGLGVVTVLRDGNKIEVMFADGSDKTLIHRR